MIDYLRKFFDVSDREIKAITPVVERINALEESVTSLTDEQLKAKTPEFRARLERGESLEAVLPEVFAVVREVGKRALAMRLFDVQLMGGLVLHQGRIAEMKTGEGKTLVAVAPLVLNALTGRGAHLVTVNDYLARRDAVWMGPIYHTLGLSVGIIQGQSADSDELGGSYIYDPTFRHEDPRYLYCRPCSRREAYLQDIVYGTNHEFGFDYLRDNMAFSVEHLSMRELNYAIVDEVDSILVDEARTPHIISGPSMQDVSIYKKVDTIVRRMKAEEHYTSDKKNHSASLTEEGMDFVEDQLGIDNIASEPLMFHHVNASVKAYALFEKNVEYVVRNDEVVIVDENTGRLMFGRRFSDGLHQALEAKEGVTVQRESQTVAVITFQNLFRMYNKLAGMTGTAKTEEDEFRKIYGLDVVVVPTHRPMVRKDNEDVVYKALDAKFRGIAREILRLYAKQQPVLVGTRSIEMSEKVSQRITSEMLQKLVMVDMLVEKAESEKSARKQVKQEGEDFFAKDLVELNTKALAGALSAIGLPTNPLSDEALSWFLKKHNLGEENREHLEEALKHGVPHNVLNAKYHEKEAAIISEAGRKGAVTIATNMAGRGVDILLGGRVADDTVSRARQAEAEDGGLATEFADTFMSFRRGGKERAAPPLPLDDQERRMLAEEVRALGGLYILGTERHESRRIDNQLRGRSGRQGDPGESRFFVSLEDQLWKIFNAKMLENPILKAWPPLEEVRAKFISGMILKTQERIENHFFEVRKHVLEYDDVLNSQREHVYAERRQILLGEIDFRDRLKQSMREMIVEITPSESFLDETGHPSYNYEGLYEKLNAIFPLVDVATLDELKSITPGPELDEFCRNAILTAYDQRVERIGEEVMPRLEQWALLHAVNDQWMSHLQMIDYIREGIGLRGYGQVDPLVAYRRETFDLFQHTLKAIRDQAVKMAFQVEVRVERPEPTPQPQMLRVTEEEAEAAVADAPAQAPRSAGPLTAAAAATIAAPVDLNSIDWKRVGRNDPCPCGSGKKFKACHYPQLRNQGVL